MDSAYSWGRITPDQAASTEILLNAASSNLFSTLHLPILAGRAFTEQEVTDRRQVALVSERLAQIYWPTGHWQGACFASGDPAQPCTQIIGIVANRHRAPPDADPIAEYYLPITLAVGMGEPSSLYDQRVLLARTTSDQNVISKRITETAIGAVPSLQFAAARPMTTLMEPGIRPWKLTASLVTVFGLIAMLLGIVGTLGVTAAIVSNSTHELGILRAIGARNSHIFQFVLRRLKPIIYVAAISGWVGGSLVLHLVPHLLFGVAPLEPSSVVLPTALLLATVFIGAALPLTRAIRITPAEALRQ